MGGLISFCCQCCSKTPQKYNVDSLGTTRSATYSNPIENLPPSYENTIHVSEIYGNNLDDKQVPSDDPNASTFFGSIFQQTSNNPIKESTQRVSFKPTTHSPRSRNSTMARALKKHSNSCSTIYVDDSTVAQPNWKAMIKCVSHAIHSQIVHRKSNRSMDIFDEKLHPITKDLVPNDYDQHDPEQRTIYRFMRILFTAAQLTAECAIVTQVYLERVLSYGELDLCPSNWKRLLLGAVMLASKVWDDQAVWNVDFCQILKDMTVNEMNELEREYVQLLQFNVNVSSSIYAKYYFDLRQLAKEEKISFPDELLTKEKAIKLEAFSNVTNRPSTPMISSSHQTQDSNGNSAVHGNPSSSIPQTSLRRSASVEFAPPARRSLLIIS